MQKTCVKLACSYNVGGAPNYPDNTIFFCEIEVYEIQKCPINIDSKVTTRYSLIALKTIVLFK